MNRTKERTVTVKSDKRCDGGYEYSYSLLLSKNGEYSINIRLNFEGERKSEASTSGIFVDAEKAIKFYDKLLRNLATPIDLAYVVEDEED